jgi:hypothetical protein
MSNDTTISTEFLKLRRFPMPEVFIGGNGDVVVVQEIPRLAGEHCIRLMLSVDDAEAVAETIKA